MTSKMEPFTVIIGISKKSFIFDGAGILGYSESYHLALITVQINYLGDTKPLTSELFFVRQKTQDGGGKTSN